MIGKCCLAVLLSCGVATGQSNVAPEPAIRVKPLAFEVVSIRPSKPGGNESTRWGTTPDGYQATGQSMWSTLMIANFPQGMAYWTKERLSGAPSWIGDLYDINAKVAESDIPAWQKQGMTLDKEPILREMLQTMLADRCRLVAHRIPSSSGISGFALLLGKHGPHLTETRPGEIFPPGVKLAGGGVLVPYNRGEKARLTYYGTTMADFAAALSMSSWGHPIEDRTGLTGQYDFVVPWVDDPDSTLPEGAVSSDDPDPLSHWNVGALGLRLAPIKLPIDTLAIDHMEKPTEN